MLNRILSLLLVGCMVFQTFSSLTIVAWFKVQQDYIEEVFCINKEKPIMQCNGKCYLAEKLKQERSEEKETPLTVETLQLTFLPSDGSVRLSPVPGYEDEKIDGFSAGKVKSYVPVIFHPPKV